jgi:hypothetical protein
MENTDGYHGFRALQCNSRIRCCVAANLITCISLKLFDHRFAVSTSNTWEVDKSYVVPKGYHWATTQEYLQEMQQVSQSLESPYYNWVRLQL